MEMIIRKFTGDDRESVLKLLRLNTPTYFAPEEEADLIYYFDYHAADYYIVEVAGEVVGAGGINFTEEGKLAKISWDIIHPDFQRTGVGSALTSFRIKNIREVPGVKTIAVRTTQHAYPFYEKFGLKIREIVKDYWAEGFDLYRMDSSIEQVNG
jgi:ribosomal-protein-alanine N-acetyltransferase